MRIGLVKLIQNIRMHRNEDKVGRFENVKCRTIHYTDQNQTNLIFHRKIVPSLYCVC